jgi:tryptophan synthase alpha chain
MVTEFRTRDGVTPIVFMGYLNPFEVMGYADFAEAAARAGVDGVITVDLPPEEAEAFVQCVRGHGMDPIFLLSPTTSDERIAKICAAASGFVYYVSLKGITGASHLDLEAVSRRVTHIKRFTSMPVGVGFGIRDAATSAAIATFADAVVVGSLLVGRIEALRHEPGRICEELSGLVAGMRRAMDEASGIRQ